ncbi:flagellar biosynthetic protein FliO [Nocardioides sp. Bht2]|uniref:flagellar biosynthetic protein FliO n=1 Tax=Nocardioides sp. Bht2 TaxID=3392297 RepID=UPI0039B61DEC
MLELTIRLIASLAVVVGLLLLTAKFFGRQFQSRHGATIQVLHRQALSRSSAVSVVAVGPRVLVLGSTDQQINVLAELDPDELDLELRDAAVTPLRPLADSSTTAPAPSEEAGDFAASLAAAATPSSVEPAASASAETEIGSSPAADLLTSRAIRQVGGQRRAPRFPRRGPIGEAKQGPLAGSILSPQTWRQAFAAASRRAS